MAEIKKILLATDFSKGSARASDMARTMTRLAGAKLILLHVITELPEKHTRRMPADVVDTLIREVELAAVKEMQEFKEQYLSDIEATTEIVIGKSEEMILEMAAAHQVDLIILGTHGRTGLDRLKVMVGSTADKVVRSSKIPVLTVRER